MEKQKKIYDAATGRRLVLAHHSDPTQMMLVDTKGNSYYVGTPDEINAFVDERVKSGKITAK